MNDLEMERAAQRRGYPILAEFAVRCSRGNALLPFAGQKLLVASKAFSVPSSKKCVLSAA